ncbi:hypothetical protein COT94_01860 [Candidatus Falkowbacteria bacterium CG10_big_fil_rev_8_21_14_0_10_37_14]|uniref:Alpha-1,2-fucosyltransferase n=1 Tax=Candidatus Falkowbacteria bacterium CG10_big_fil_rev_8_21_14_0_10_37_14 TaxID=1974561 RepID=A0A2M6WTS2_9BACT|nr:alpha-1,2-fucosyltransferase [Candidatus Falkowbacteria bacterium]PIT96192.1 MAG: hypothetical protein COT94_01860 [Candidatus Falkowbacteria bacterium CG10_big_fil_rev_8_21_14_0_10_37_14]
MFVIKLKDGLGNQMFQYALAKSLFLSIDQGVFMDIAFSQYKEDTKRQYALDCFCVDDRIKFIDVLRIPWIFRDPASDLLKKIFIQLRLKGLFVKGWKYCLETKCDKVFNRLSSNRLVYFDGYWQSEKYFSGYRQDILKDFTLVKTSRDFDKRAHNIKGDNSVSIHIRRGDYLTNRFASAVHPLCSLDYYSQAIELIKSKISNPKFFVFSDDPDWVKNNLPLNKDESVIVSGSNLKDCEELILMSYCEHQIIANSTFSWWGAWLNKNAEKIVIAPKQWLKCDVQPKDLIPDNWIQL